MAKKCEITGAKAMYGNRVSHANNKTRRRQDVNLQEKRVWDADKGAFVRIRATTRAFRTLDKHGGLASWRRKAAKKA